VTDPTNLEALRSRISAEAPYVKKKQYSHNIISACLRLIEKHHGREAANEAIEDHGLERLGWSKQ
jgi:hypothetical protein